MKLKCISSAALEFVRKFVVPLPSEATLQKLFGFMHCIPGLVTPAFEYLRDLVPRMSNPGENLAALSFDEAKIDEKTDYDSKIDAYLGPHAYAQQTFVKSLYGSWKLPIFTEFDRAMTKDILLEIIKKLADINVVVLIVISDQGGGNSTVATQLGVTTEQVYFFHPETNQKIFFASDWVHLHKSLR